MGGWGGAGVVVGMGVCVCVRGAGIGVKGLTSKDNPKKLHPRLFLLLPSLWHGACMRYITIKRQAL